MNQDLKNLFILEVKELLEQFEDDLINLENSPNKQQLIDEVFRFVHSIKGAAGMYGFNEIVIIVHNLEEIFRKIKQGKLQLNQNIIDLSLKAKDLILSLLESKKINGLTQDLQALIQNLEQFNPELKDFNQRFNKPQTGQKTYYIIFHPDADIYQRAINLSSIIDDIQKLKYSLIKPFEAPKQQGKFDIFWEIVAYVEDESELKQIFVFVEDEIKKEQLCDCNAFQLPGFKQFYQNLGNEFSPERLEKLRKFIQDNLSHGSQQTQTQAEKQQTPDLAINEQSLNYVRLPAYQLDNLLKYVTQLITYNYQLQVAIDKGDTQQIKFISQTLQSLINEIKDYTLQLRLLPISVLFRSYNRLVRDLAIQQNKKVRLILEGEDTMIDKTYIEKLYTPLLHIIRNAIDHGIETPQERIAKNKSPVGIVKISAYQSHANLIIQVQDDGRGIDLEQIRKRALEMGLIGQDEVLSDEELLKLIFSPGLTTSVKVDEISGRGMGMNVIRTAIAELKGEVEVDTEPGLGTTITIKLPTTLSIIETLHLSAGGINFLLPVFNIVSVEKLHVSQIKGLEQGKIEYRGETVPVLDISEFLELEQEQMPEKRVLVILSVGQCQYGLIFDQVYGQISAVVKNLGAIFYALDFFIGASILGDGRIAYILDPFKVYKC